ncbi:TadE family protein [Micromonospora sp. WMMD1082]|uniref:TadE family protein n=1 Tax=Micromonospora sp. WMMD1082 TaxID=3016104 RepID=UPI0024168F1A|nr:TadE family protein [Micromonospora sp. WMMD1082]MDG4795433.1 TadE family protein [Micromonospora sp. WMMD1082]
MRRWTCRLRRALRVRRDRGSTSVEMVGFAIPGTVMAIVLAYSAFNLGLSSLDVTTAAAAAARAASLQRTASAAAVAAQNAAADTLATGSATCADLDVETDTSRWGRGGTVTVTVRCTVLLRRMSGLDFIPGSLTTSARATAPLETYRTVDT